jgi:hypothetical protein
MLMYGTRASVDQCMYRLVQSGEIQRVARGVFIRSDCQRRPGLAEIKLVKARSFGRKIVGYGKEAAKKLGLIADRAHSMTSLSNGRSSSFRSYDHGRYFAHATSPRKMNVGNGIVGKVVKALWYVGGDDMKFEVVKDAISKLDKKDWSKLYKIWHFMPHWMVDRILFYESERVQDAIFARKNPATP